MKNDQDFKPLGINTVVVASGYFDPIHVGHIEYLEKARALGDKLIVVVMLGGKSPKKSN